MKKTYHLMIMLLALGATTITTSCSREDSVIPSVSKKSKLSAFDYSSLPSISSSATTLLNSDYVEVSSLPTGINGTGGAPFCDVVRYFQYVGNIPQTNMYVILSGYKDANKDNAVLAVGGCNQQLTSRLVWDVKKGDWVTKEGCFGPGNTCSWVPQTDDKGTATPLDDKVYWIINKCD